MPPVEARELCRLTLLPPLNFWKNPAIVSAAETRPSARHSPGGGGRGRQNCKNRGRPDPGEVENRSNDAAASIRAAGTADGNCGTSSPPAITLPVQLGTKRGAHHRAWRNDSSRAIHPQSRRSSFAASVGSLLSRLERARRSRIRVSMFQTGQTDYAEGWEECARGVGRQVAAAAKERRKKKKNERWLLEAALACRSPRGSCP